MGFVLSVNSILSHRPPDGRGSPGNAWDDPEPRLEEEGKHRFVWSKAQPPGLHTTRAMNPLNLRNAAHMAEEPQGMTGSNKGPARGDLVQTCSLPQEHPGTQPHSFGLACLLLKNHVTCTELVAFRHFPSKLVFQKPK